MPGAPPRASIAVAAAAEIRDTMARAEPSLLNHRAAPFGRTAREGEDGVKTASARPPCVAAS